jgi:hypothetical protein
MASLFAVQTPNLRPCTSVPIVLLSPSLLPHGTLRSEYALDGEQGRGRSGTRDKRAQ